MKLLLSSTFLLISICSFGQYFDVNKISLDSLTPWKDKDISRYEGSYRFGTNDAESEFRIIVADSIVVAQNRYYNHDILDSFKTFSNVKIIGNRFYSDQTNGEFVCYNNIHGVVSGLLINSPWTKKFNEGGEFGSRFPEEELYMVGRFSIASKRILKDSDLAKYSIDQLRLMRNEIYARYGLRFQKGGQIDKYFTGQRWYKATQDKVDRWLTSIELSNIEAIKREERKKNDL